MRESPAELAELQALIDRSFAAASAHLRGIMEPQRRLTAERIVADVPSPAVLNIATVTRSGEPRLSAVDGHFLHGRWFFTTAGDSPKARQLAARPAISASYTPRDGFGMFCHGSAVLLEGAEQQALRTHWVGVYGGDPEDLGTIAYYRLQADWLVAFAMTPEEQAEIDARR